MTVSSRDQPGPHVVPAAPAAWIPQDKEKIKRFDYGIIRVVVEGSETPRYMQKHQEDGYFIVTTDPTHASRFRFDTGSSSRLLEYVGGRWSSWLAMHWPYDTFDVGRGSDR
ncbi:hypothetical protein FRC01_011943 [Tulasnella sp. 417]|nr:hypothetical protein FRC01_011943 [Tulasnella sp. 417]